MVRIPTKLHVQFISFKKNNKINNILNRQTYLLFYFRAYISGKFDILLHCIISVL